MTEGISLIVLVTKTENATCHDAKKSSKPISFEGFRRGDHQQILACLTDDVVWDLPGYRHLAGKAAFDQEIENEAFVGRPTLTVDRLIEETDTVVAIGNGKARQKSGEVHRFAFCDVFTFAGDKMSRVESYLVPLKEGG